MCLCHCWTSLKNILFYCIIWAKEAYFDNVVVRCITRLEIYYLYLILTNSFANFCLSPLAAHVRYQDGHRSTFNCRPFNSDLNLCWLYCIFDLTFDKNAVCALGGASLYNLPMICWIQGAPANQRLHWKFILKAPTRSLSPLLKAFEFLWIRYGAVITNV